jgi:hypothetical protein
MATIHPAAIIRRERLEKQSAMAYRLIPALDLKRLLEATRKGRDLLPLPDIEFHPPDFKPGEEFVFDLETGSMWRPTLIGVQNVKGGPVFSLAWQTVGKEWARENFARRDLNKIGHNIQGFDLRVLEAEGIVAVPPFEDTMALAGMCEPDLPRGLYFQWAFYHGHVRPFWKKLAGANPTKPHEVRAQRALRAAWVATGMTKGLVNEGAVEDEWEAFYNMLDVDGTRLNLLAMRERFRKEGWT